VKVEAGEGTYTAGKLLGAGGAVGRGQGGVEARRFGSSHDDEGHRRKEGTGGKRGKAGYQDGQEGAIEAEGTERFM
jgi:hypothetical protein